MGKADMQNVNQQSNRKHKKSGGSLRRFGDVSQE
jgi:hypothetical protein